MWNQFLSINYGIYKSFECGYEFIRVFLDTA